MTTREKRERLEKLALEMVEEAMVQESGKSPDLFFNKPVEWYDWEKHHVYLRSGAKSLRALLHEPEGREG